MLKKVTSKGMLMDWANSGDKDWAEQVLNAEVSRAIRKLFTSSELVDRDLRKDSISGLTQIVI